MSRMQERDAWRVLDLEPGTDPETVARAYRREAARRHPDTGGDRDGWDELQEAYATLVAAGDAGVEEVLTTELGPARRSRRQWLVPLVVRVVLGAVLLALPAWYLLGGPAANVGVPWQVRVGLLSYGVVWWVIAVAAVFRRPRLHEVRWSIVPVPMDEGAREKLADRLAGFRPGRRGGGTSRQSDDL